MDLYFKENYDSIFNIIQNKPFYIFGNTLYAQTFYLYCVEKKIVRNLKAFILSDINNLKDNRKLPMIHSIPVKDINWLKENGTECHIFLAAKEKTIHEQLFPLLKNDFNGGLYYVSDFINLIMHYHYMSSAYKNIINRYAISSNTNVSGWLNISDSGDTDFYIYVARVQQGVLPDPNIFNNKFTLNELFQDQLGSYTFITSKRSQYTNNLHCKIYMARSHFDSELQEEFYTPCTEPIQAGADLTDTEISELKDNTGDNISRRNQDYCEMSAVYWAWKNDRASDYIGLCHYRRRFIIDECTVRYMMADGYDAVYAVPYLRDGGIREEFVERSYFLTPEMWDLTGNAIERLSPGYYDSWKKLDRSYFLLACNMFIMRRDTFTDYCAWVFQILEEVDKHYLEQGIQCNNRYLGYIAEVLNTVYVMKHKDTLKKGFIEMKVLKSS